MFHSSRFLLFHAEAVETGHPEQSEGTSVHVLTRDRSDITTQRESERYKEERQRKE